MGLTMSAILFAAAPVTKPIAIGIGVAVIVAIYVAFKVGKFLIKSLLLLAVLAVIGLILWQCLAR